MNLGVLYLKFSVKALLSRPSITTLMDLIRYFRAWQHHLSQNKNSVEDAQPWMAFGAIDFLRKKIRKNMSVFEYGSGGSTLFWAQHAAKVVSIEHHEGWYQQMKKVFEQKAISNVEYKFIPASAEPSANNLSFKDPDSYLSGDETYRGYNFKDYVLSIEQFAAGSLDLVIVDGRARPSCVQHAMPKIAKGGFLVLDNTERDYYLANFNFPETEWNKWTFNGPVPYNYHFSQTTVFQKK